MKNDLKHLLYETIIAQAIGDAFGYVIEFKTWARIKKDYGKNGFEFKQLESIETLNVSDDTQMTLFCLEGFINSNHDAIESIYKEYLFWLNTQGIGSNGCSRLSIYHELFFKRAPGFTCISSLNSKKMGTVENPINTSKGCGGIMRTIPCAFFAHSLTEAFNLGCNQAAITHGHPTGYLSAGVYSAIAYQLIQNTDITIIKAIENTYDILSIYDNHQETLDECNNVIKVINGDRISHVNLNKTLGEGWIANESLSIALYVAASYDNFKDVIYQASNHSGDSDSTTMLAAGLWYLKNRNSSEFIHYAEKLDVIRCIKRLIYD